MENRTSQIFKKKNIHAQFSSQLPLQIMEFVVVAKCDNFYMSNSHKANQKR